MKFSWRRMLSSKSLLLLAIVVLIFLIIVFGREFYRRYYLNQQIAALEQKISQLESKNQEFGQLIQYFDTQNFTEEEARLKLGLKKPGEEVVVINQPENLTGSGSQNDKVAALSNPQKWWYYFVN